MASGYYVLVLRRSSSVVTFVAGFLFDLVTMQRIDAWLDLAFQLGYLASLTALLVYQHREVSRAVDGEWATASWWRYNVELLHFFYGGLLSAYIVLYFRSSTSSRPAVFLVFARWRHGHQRGATSTRRRVRAASRPVRVLRAVFLTYFIPIIVGSIDAWVFLLSLLLSGAIVWQVTRWLEPGPDLVAERRAMSAPAAGVLVFIGALYVLRLIPPVPLSVQFQGIYHDVRRDSGGYTLVYPDPPAWALWRRDSRPFERRAGDRLHYFVRVFAPSGFRHRVVIRWDVFDPRVASGRRPTAFWSTWSVDAQTAFEDRR